jgi:hypothetical protein
MVPRRGHLPQAAAWARIPQKRIPILRSEYAQNQNWRWINCGEEVET